MAEDIIAPKQERVVDFYGDVVPVAQVDGGKLYVPLRALADNLGLSFAGQADRVRRDRVMAGKSRLVEVSGADGKVRPQICLPLEMIPGWLFGISTSRVKPELQDRLDLYRAECFNVLWDAFKDDVMPAARQQPAPTAITTAEQTLEMAAVVYHLAQQQVEMERRVHDVEEKQGTIANYMRGFIHETRARLTALELRLDPASQITEEQSGDLAIAVKTLAHELEQRGKVGTYQSGYARVYSEMYRRFDIKSYKNLRRDRYDAAMKWLREWYDQVVGKGEGEAGGGD
jgi:P22_AR N-terminal domain/ORF6C domain